MEPLSKFHLNVYPGGGDKGNWSQPMGKKNFLRENACSSWALSSKKSQWLQGGTSLQAGSLSPGVKVLFSCTCVSFFTGGHISSGLWKPLRSKSFELAVKAKAPDNISIIHNLDKVSISPPHHLQTHHGTVVSQGLCDPPLSMSHPRTSHWGAGTDAAGEEEPAVDLAFSVPGFSPNPAKRWALWGLSRCTQSHALMHVCAHKGAHFPWTLFWETLLVPLPFPSSQAYRPVSSPSTSEL